MGEHISEEPNKRVHQQMIWDLVHIEIIQNEKGAHGKENGCTYLKPSTFLQVHFSDEEQAHAKGVPTAGFFAEYQCGE